MKPRIFAIITLTLLLCVGCRELLPTPQNGSGVASTISFNILGANFQEMQTRNQQIEKIDNLELLVFDKNGKRTHYSTVENYDSSKVYVNIPDNTFRLVVFGNTDGKFEYAKTHQDLLDHKIDYTELLLMRDTDLMTINPSDGSKIHEIQPITLLRNVAKVTTVFDFSGLNSDTKITPTKVVLRQTPKQSGLYIGNKPGQGNDVYKEGQSISHDVLAESHSAAKPLYTLENMQGENGDSNTTQAGKHPPSGAHEWSTYLEVEATLENSDGTRDMAYRYYLGANTTTDFNVIRNHWYQVDLNFKGNGGIDENSWRVTVGDIQGDDSAPQELPNDIHLPALGNRTYTFNVGVPIDFSQEGNTQVDVVWKSIENTGYLYIDDNHTENERRYIGKLNYGDNQNIRLYRARGDQPQIAPEVTTLLFPRNSTFGHNNYTITQYVNFLVDDETEIDNFSAQSTADWLYICCGSKCQSFTAVSNIGQMQTCDMYNKSKGKLPLSELKTPQLAVRCKDNTTNKPRSAYIIFYNSSNEAYGLIYVNQNPSGYPASPFHISKINEGTYKPGAFTNDGKVDSRYPSTSPRVEFYAHHTDFYVSSTEITCQQYADFLNDAGITNLEQLIGTNSILDKTDITEDNYAKHPPRIMPQTNTVLLNQKTIKFEKGKWMPETSKIIGPKSQTAFSKPIPLSNFAMEYLTFFSAADYNYWALKYSGQTTTRSTDALLITELQWEAAARSAQNGAGSIAQYNNDNGLYPFPVFDHITNSKLPSAAYEIDQYNTIEFNSHAWHSGRNVGGNTHVGTAAMGSKYPVALLIPNAAGLYDMSGNVGEWAWDLMWDWRYDIVEGSFVSNYWGHTRGAHFRCARGGSVDELPAAMLVSGRNYRTPNENTLRLGIRAVMR